MKRVFVSAAIVLLATAFHCILAVKTDRDRQAWGFATSKYFAEYPKNEVRSYRTTPDSFNNRVENFKEKALEHARTTKVLPIVDWVRKSPSEPQRPVREATYFTSIIKPGDELHREMGLSSNVVSFPFWKHEAGKFHLLYLDTLNLEPMEWEQELKPLQQVLLQH